jgi:hypothetical protein
MKTDAELRQDVMNDLSREYPITLQACDTLPSVLANLINPSLFLMIFYSVVI